MSDSELPQEEAQTEDEAAGAEDDDAPKDFVVGPRKATVTAAEVLFIRTLCEFVGTRTNVLSSAQFPCDSADFLKAEDLVDFIKEALGGLHPNCVLVKGKTSWTSDDDKRLFNLITDPNGGQLTKGEWTQHSKPVRKVGPCTGRISKRFEWRKTLDEKQLLAPLGTRRTDIAKALNIDDPLGWDGKISFPWVGKATATSGGGVAASRAPLKPLVDFLLPSDGSCPDNQFVAFAGTVQLILRMRMRRMKMRTVRARRVRARRARATATATQTAASSAMRQR